MMQKRENTEIRGERTALFASQFPVSPQMSRLTALLLVKQIFPVDL